MPGNDLFEIAAQYRTGLRKMFDVVRIATGGCQCDLRDDWSQLMDAGAKNRTPEITNDGVVCLACLIEGVYEEAIGEDFFRDEMIAEMKVRLGDKKVIAEYTDENGKTHYGIFDRSEVEEVDEDPSTD